MYGNVFGNEDESRVLVSEFDVVRFSKKPRGKMVDKVSELSKVTTVGSEKKRIRRRRRVVRPYTAFEYVHFYATNQEGGISRARPRSTVSAYLIAHISVHRILSVPPEHQNADIPHGHASFSLTHFPCERDKQLDIFH